MHSHAFYYLLLAAILSTLSACFYLRWARVPNSLLLPGATTGLVAHLVWDGWCSCATAAITGVVVGLLVVGIYTLGGLGAADGKLLMVVACIDGPYAFGRTIIITCIVAFIALTIVTPAARALLSNVSREDKGVLPGRWVPQALEKVGSWKRMNLPYAAVIAMGCLASFSLCNTGGAA